jgi:hypothetical protein
MDHNGVKQAKRTGPVEARDDPLLEGSRSLLEACQRNYQHYPNVLGIGMGSKFIQGRRTSDASCVHFYVHNKPRNLPRRQLLPRFVFGRSSTGALDRTRRYATDVIELKGLRFACGAGTEIEAIGASGALTLLFQNRAPGQSGQYLVTCAHVAGDVRQSPPVDPEIRFESAPQVKVYATTLANSTARQGTVEYDIALARLNPGSGPLPELHVANSPVILRRFMPASQLRPGLRLDCAFPVSNVAFATLASQRISLPLRLDGQSYQVNNLFLIDHTPRPGDSGGLLYMESEAAGILVGLAENWGLFQPLDEAMAYLQQISPIPIACFKTTKTKNTT